MGGEAKEWVIEVIEWFSKPIDWLASNLDFGRVQFEAEDWYSDFRLPTDQLGLTGRLSGTPPSGSPDGWYFRYRFLAKLFNERKTATGLHGFAIQFTRGHNLNLVLIFEDRFESRFDPVRTIDLPSRQWVTPQVHSQLEWNPALYQADAVWFLARFPNGRAFRKRIAKLRGLKSLTTL